MKKSFNDSAWRQKQYENRLMLSEANGQTSIRSLKNVMALYEDLMMGIEMNIVEKAGTNGPEYREWRKIDDALNKNFILMQRWIQKNKKIMP